MAVSFFDFARALRALIRRKAACALAAWLLCGACRAAGGPIVEVLSSDAAPYQQARDGFEKGIGSRAGDCRFILLKQVREQGIAATIGADADCVVCIGTPAAAALAGRLADKPMIFCMVPGPAALALSKAKLTHGVTTQIPLADQFKLIGEALPSARSLGMLYRSNTPDGQKLLKDAQDALPAGWHIEAVAVDQFSSVADAINELTGRRLDLIWTSVDAGVYDGPVVHALLLAALRNNLPVFGFSASFVRAGALLGVGVDPAAQGNQAARIVLQILGHAWDDHNTGVQPPESFQIAVNQIVADKIGVSLPPELLNRSTYVFKDDK